MTDQKDHAEVVAAFYDAVSTRDPAAISAVLDESFADDVVMSWPPSLPYGGEVTGAATLRAMFGAMAGAEVKVGPDALTVDGITASGNTVTAQVSFDWYPPGKHVAVPSGASEVWTFEGGSVVSVRAYYWDTAALVAAMA